VFTVANIYTSPNLEDTAVIVEASAFHDGIVVVQVNEIVGPSLDAIGRALKSSN
jgi:malonate decarboxylase alpha subunit